LKIPKNTIVFCSPSPIFPIHIPLAIIDSSFIPLKSMASIFSPLALPTQQHDLPQNYSQRIKCFSAEGDITTQQHFDRFNEFVDLEEVYHEDVKMKLFAHFFTGEVKKWFRGLTTGSIHNFQEFEQVFMRKWESKKNYLQLLTQHDNFKRSSMEIVQEFSTRFMRFYDSIPDQDKPPPRAS
jgi:hypothetical protein